jgi:hypothetical protein
MLWGDDQFAKVVARKPAEIRDLVVSNIDYAWSDPEWHPYPKTLVTSPDSITQRPEANNPPPPNLLLALSAFLIFFKDVSNSQPIYP